MDGMPKEQSPPQQPTMVILPPEIDDIYLRVYAPANSAERPFRRAGELGDHLRKEWRVVAVASLCGVALTLGLLTFRSSIRNIPESQVAARARVEFQTASTRQPVASPAAEETERLRVRNRRLEALVQVLSRRNRQR